MVVVLHISKHNNIGCILLENKPINNNSSDHLPLPARDPAELDVVLSRRARLVLVSRDVGGINSLEAQFDASPVPLEGLSTV